MSLKTIFIYLPIALETTILCLANVVNHMNHISLNKTTKICAARTTNLKSCLVYRFMEIQGNTKRAKQNTIIEKGMCSDIFSRCDIYNCIYISIMLILM